MTDLLALSKTWKPGQTVNLTDTEYTTSGQIILVGLAGLKIVAKPGTILHAPPKQSVFEVHSANVQIIGFTIPIGGVVYHVVQPGFYASGASLGIGMPNGSIQQAILAEQNATNAVFDGFNIGVTASESCYFYCDGDTLQNSTFAGSQGEYVLRVSAPDEDVSRRPKNVLISNCTLSNIPSSQGGPNGPGKPIFDFRTGDGTITGCQLHGWCGTGETAQTVPGTNVNLTIKNCNFFDEPPDHAYIEARGGSIVTTSGNNFSAPKGNAIVAGSGARIQTGGGDTSSVPLPTAMLDQATAAAKAIAPAGAAPTPVAIAAQVAHLPAPTSPPIAAPVALFGTGQAAGKGVALKWAVPLAALALLLLVAA